MVDKIYYVRLYRRNTNSYLKLELVAGSEKLLETIVRKAYPGWELDLVAMKGV